MKGETLHREDRIERDIDDPQWISELARRRLVEIGAITHARDSLSNAVAETTGQRWRRRYCRSWREVPSVRAAPRLFPALRASASSSMVLRTASVTAASPW